MTDFLLDSDVVIWILRGRQEAVEFVDRCARLGTLNISALTVAEILRGVRAGEEDRTNSLIDGLRVIAVDAPIAKRAAVYLRAHASSGLGFADALIAATAAEYGLQLVTYNVRHYPMADFRLIAPSSAGL